MDRLALPALTHALLAGVALLCGAGVVGAQTSEAATSGQQSIPKTVPDVVTPPGGLVNPVAGGAGGGGILPPNMDTPPTGGGGVGGGSNKIGTGGKVKKIDNAVAVGGGGTGGGGSGTGGTGGGGTDPPDDPPDGDPLAGEAPAGNGSAGNGSAGNASAGNSSAGNASAGSQGRWPDIGSASARLVLVRVLGPSGHPLRGAPLRLVDTLGATTDRALTDGRGMAWLLLPASLEAGGLSSFSVEGTSVSRVPVRGGSIVGVRLAGPLQSKSVAERASGFVSLPGF